MVVPRVASVIRLVEPECPSCGTAGRRGWLVDLIPERPETSVNKIIWDESEVLVIDGER